MKDYKLKNVSKLVALIIGVLFSSLVFGNTSKELAVKDVKSSYGIEVNKMAPDFSISDIQGNKFNLKNEVKTGPVVLVFYRGGWCPFCNIQLRSLQTELVPQLSANKAKLVVISVDSLDEASKTDNNENLDMTVISDSDASILKLYNVAYKVPGELVTKYINEYKIDLEKSSGKKHHLIAVPSVFVINKSGKIIFSHIDENYKVRVENSEIIEALKTTL